nr:putative ribonuclease H-like domain-containing protein [Tanacetum cinerariifolium]
ECRSPRDNRNKETTRRTVLAKVSTSNDLVSQCSASSSRSDNEVAPCSKACLKSYATLQTHYDNLTVEFRKSQLDVLSYKTGLESVEARLVVYQKNETMFEKGIKLLKLDVMLRDNALVELRKKFEKSKNERNDLMLTLDKFHTLSKNLSKLLASQVSDKTGLGFDSQVFNCQVSDCEELHNHKSDNRVPKNPENDRYKTCEGYHVVPPPYTRIFLPPKPDLVFTDDLNTSESVVNVESSVNNPSKDMSKTHRPDALIVKDWIYDSEDETEIESVPKQREPSFVTSTEHVKSSRESVKKVEHHKQAANLRTNNQKSRVRMTHSHSNRDVVPTTVLTRLRLVSLNAARPVPTAVTQSTMKSTWPVKHVVNKAYSPQALKDKGVIDSGCSRHMTKNISFLLEFEEIDGGYVAFGGNPKGGKISSKGKIKTGKLYFDDVYFVKELKFDLFSVIQMCDKKNSVLFTDTECVILSFDYKLRDENHMLLRVPRENNMYNVDLKNVVPSRDLTCLFANATLDESNLWYRRLGHINFKTMNKLVKGNLVRGLPSKIFKNNHTCVAYQNGKQYTAFCKSKPVSFISQPLQRLHMDLFGPTFVKSLNKKSYCLVITDDCSRFSWVFFLATKDETSAILKTFKTGIENQINHKVKIIRCNNKTEFKNYDLNQLCGMKGIKREFSVARTPQQNGIAERKNKTLIEATRTMLADSLYPFLFGLRIEPKWLFDIDTLTMSINYQPVVAGNQPNDNVDNKNDVYVSANGSDNTDNKKHDEMDKRDDKGKSPVDSLIGVSVLRAEFEEFSFNNCNRVNAVSAPVNAVGPNLTNSTNSFNTASPFVNVVSLNFRIAIKFSFVDPFKSPDDIDMLELEDIVYSDDEEDVGAEAGLSNLETNIPGHTQEEGIDYDEVFSPVVRIEAIQLFLAYASFMGFMVYQIDVKSTFLYRTIEEEVLVDLPKGKRVIGSKWVFRNKKDERRIMIRNKAGLVTQGHTQEEGIDYDEVFSPVVRIEAIQLFLAYASFMGFMVYQIDVKSTFLYRTIEEEGFSAVLAVLKPKRLKEDRARNE